MNDLFGNAKTVTAEDIVNPDKEITGEIVSTMQMDSLTRAEIDIAITTAKRYPRNITSFRNDALSMATIDEETAAACFYKLPRGKDMIEGPGVRLAEIAGTAYGNMRYGARIVNEGPDYIVAQGVAHDLEKNISTTIEVRRRIRGKDGRRYNTDMIQVTANAACSIAIRNAIFKVIPKVYINEIYKAAKRVAIGNAETLSERRRNALDYFMKMGVTEDRLLAVLDKKGIDDITLEDIETLIGLKTAIKDGDTTVDQAFPPLKPEKKYNGSDEAVKPK